MKWKLDNQKLCCGQLVAHVFCYDLYFIDQVTLRKFIVLRTNDRQTDKVTSFTPIRFYCNV